MCLDMFAFSVQISVSTLADFQRPKVVLFADGILAGSTRNLPSKASVTVVA